MYQLCLISVQPNVVLVILDWSREFDAQFDRMEADGTPEGVQRFQLLVFMLKQLAGRAAAPTEDTAMLKRVRQSRRHQVWRVSHPYRAGVALRLICWFPPERSDTVVVALFAGDKVGMGDVFYDSVGTRADQMIARWRQEEEAS